LRCVAVSSDFAEEVDLRENKLFTFTKREVNSSPSAPTDNKTTTTAKSGAKIILVFFIMLLSFSFYNYIDYLKEDFR